VVGVPPTTSYSQAKKARFRLPPAGGNYFRLRRLLAMKCWSMS